VIDVTEAVIEGTYPEREANTDRLRRVVRTPQRAPSLYGNAVSIQVCLCPRGAHEGFALILARHPSICECSILWQAIQDRGSFCRGGDPEVFFYE
jgi:hypothetical protein